MQTRVALNIIVLAGFSFGWLISDTVFSPSATLVKNTATLSTVNGGNVEYVASHAVHRSLEFPWLLACLLVITMVFWAGPVYRAIFKKDETKKE